MAKESILAIDDDEDILELVRYNLERANYQVKAVTSGEEALDAARSFLPDAILLDLMLPGVDGLEVCRILKNDSQTSAIPILMLTALGEEADIVTGLELGADDYVTKPFSPRVLMARVKALLRRQNAPASPEVAVLKAGDIVINSSTYEVLAGEKPVDLTHSEFQLLFLLARRPGWVFTRNQIIDNVHGEDYSVTDRSVDVLVSGLRKKLGESGKNIETVRGVGYRFRE